MSLSAASFSLSPAERQVAALRAICDAVVDSIRVAGTGGVPGGTLYAALMHHGCTLEQFEGLMSALIGAGKVSKRGELYFVVAS